MYYCFVKPILIRIIFVLKVHTFSCSLLSLFWGVHAQSCVSDLWLLVTKKQDEDFHKRLELLQECPLTFHGMQEIVSESSL